MFSSELPLNLDLFVKSVDFPLQLFDDRIFQVEVVFEFFGGNFELVVFPEKVIVLKSELGEVFFQGVKLFYCGLLSYVVFFDQFDVLHVDHVSAFLDLIDFGLNYIKVGAIFCVFVVFDFLGEFFEILILTDFHLDGFTGYSSKVLIEVVVLNFQQPRFLI